MSRVTYHELDCRYFSYTRRPSSPTVESLLWRGVGLHDLLKSLLTLQLCDSVISTHREFLSSCKHSLPYSKVYRAFSTFALYLRGENKSFASEGISLHWLKDLCHHFLLFFSSYSLKQLGSSWVSQGVDLCDVGLRKPTDVPTKDAPQRAVRAKTFLLSTKLPALHISFYPLRCVCAHKHICTPFCFHHSAGFWSSFLASNPMLIFVPHCAP